MSEQIWKFTANFKPVTSTQEIAGKSVEGRITVHRDSLTLTNEPECPNRYEKLVIEWVESKELVLFNTLQKYGFSHAREIPIEQVREADGITVKPTFLYHLTQMQSRIMGLRNTLAVLKTAESIETEPAYEAIYRALHFGNAEMGANISVIERRSLAGEGLLQDNGASEETCIAAVARYFELMRVFPEKGISALQTQVGKEYGKSRTTISRWIKYYG